MCVCMCVHVHVCACVHVYMCMCVHVCVCARVCMSMCVHAHYVHVSVTHTTYNTQYLAQVSDEAIFHDGLELLGQFSAMALIVL